MTVSGWCSSPRRRRVVSAGRQRPGIRVESEHRPGQGGPGGLEPGLFSPDPAMRLGHQPGVGQMLVTECVLGQPDQCFSVRGGHRAGGCAGGQLAGMPARPSRRPWKASVQRLHGRSGSASSCPASPPVSLATTFRFCIAGPTATGHWAPGRSASGQVRTVPEGRDPAAGHTHPHQHPLDRLGRGSSESWWLYSSLPSEEVAPVRVARFARYDSITVASWLQRRPAPDGSRNVVKSKSKPTLLASSRLVTEHLTGAALAGGGMTTETACRPEMAALVSGV